MKLAREKKLVFQTGYMWRFHPGLDRIIDAVQHGWLGDVFLVRAQMNSLVEAKRRPEWAEFKGGSMFELGLASTWDETGKLVSSALCCRGATGSDGFENGSPIVRRSEITGWSRA